jgi:hypothetical protein
MALAVLISNLASADNSISVLHGNGYKTAESERTILRLDGLKLDKDYLLYYRADVSSFDNSNSLLNTRVIGHYGNGLHVSGQLQNAKGVSIRGIGGGYSYFTKNISFFSDVNYVVTSFNTDGFQSFTYTKANLTDNIFLDGYVDITMYPNLTNTLLTQPSINYQFGNLVFGLEQHIYINKGSVKDLNENLTMLKLKYQY